MSIILYNPDDENFKDSLEIYNNFSESLKQTLESYYYRILIANKLLIGVIINDQNCIQKVILKTYHNSILPSKLSLLKKYYKKDLYKNINIHSVYFVKFILEKMILDKRLKINSDKEIIPKNYDKKSINEEEFYHKLEPARSSKQRRLAMFNNFFKRCKITVSPSTKSLLYNEFINIRRNMELINEQDIHPDCLKILSKSYINMAIKVGRVHIVDNNIICGGTLLSNGLPVKKIFIIRKSFEKLFFVINLLSDDLYNDFNIHEIHYKLGISVSPITLLKKEDKIQKFYNQIFYNQKYFKILLNNGFNNIIQNPDNSKKITYKNDNMKNVLFGITLNKKFINIYLRYATQNIPNKNLYTYLYNTLDKDIISTICATIPSGNLDCYNFLQNSPEKLVRMQALRAYPILFWIVKKYAKNTLNGIWLTYYDKIMNTIDNKEPLLPIFKEMGFSKPVIKVLLSRSWHVFGTKIFYELDQISPDILNAYIQEYNIKRIYKKDRIFFNKLGMINRIPRPMIHKYGKLDNIKLENHHHLDLLQLLSKLAPMSFINQETETTINIDNNAYYMNHNLINMDTKSLKPVSENTKLIIFDDINDLLEASERYHNNFRNNNVSYLDQINEAISSAICLYKKTNTKEDDKDFDFSNWPAISDTYHHELGTLTFITNDVLLKQEGKTMQHCVGGYISSCLSMRSFIAHIKSDNHHSTIEFNLSPNSEKLGIIQNQGKMNQKPHINCDIIAKDFVKSFKVTTDIHNLITTQNKKYIMNSRYNNLYNASEAFSIALPYIKNILPRRYRKMPMDKLRSLLQQDDVIVSNGVLWI